MPDLPAFPLMPSLVCEQMPASPSDGIMSTSDQEISVVFPLPGHASQMPVKLGV